MSKNKISFFYNNSSKKVINASCNSFEFAQWGISNSQVFNLDHNHKIHQLNFKTDSKIFERAIYGAGWSYVNINDDNCIIGALNFQTGKEVLRLVGKENNLQSACLKIGDLDTVFLEKNDIQAFLNTGEFENHIFNNHLAKNIELNELIKELKLLDCCEQIFVFGSITNGKIVPPDLDIFIDATEINLNPETQDNILKLVEKYHLRLDPYIKTVKNIFAVDANIFTYEFNWIDLKSTDKYHIFNDFEQWEKEARSGHRLHCISLLPVTMQELLKDNIVEKKLKLKY